MRSRSADPGKNVKKEDIRCRKCRYSVFRTGRICNYEWVHSHFWGD